MRIVHVLGYFQPEFGYEEYYTARRQARMGHEVHVIASDRYFPFRELSTLLKDTGADDTSRKRPVGSEEVEGFTIHRLPGVVETFYDLILVKGMRALLERLRPDVVHSHGVRQGTPAMPARHLDLGFAFVIDQHGYASSYADDGSLKDAVVRTEYDLLRRPMANYAFRRAHAIVAVTEMSRQFLVDHHGVPEGEVQVLPLGVETDIFHRRLKARDRIRKKMGVGAGDILLVTAGRLDPAKGLERIIDAMVIASGEFDGRLKLALIGSGDTAYQDRLKERAAKVLPDGAVEFLPFQPKEKLPDWFSAADIGVWGKAAITILEAMACGLPVVVPGDETAAHLVSHGNGRGFDASASGDGAVSELASIIAEMGSDPKSLGDMGDNAVKVVKEKYDYKVRTRKLMDIYERAIVRSKGTR